MQALATNPDITP